MSYASGGVFGQLHVHGTPGPVLATGSMLAAAVALAPLALAEPPTQAPGAAAVAGLVALILLPTVIGQLLLFRILRLHGSRRLSLVTYLMPAFAIVYGAALLDEEITAAAIGGLALILVGVPIFGLHWLWIQRAAARVEEERTASLRALFLYLVLLVTLIPVAQNLLAILNRALMGVSGLDVTRALLGSHQSWKDNLIAIVSNGVAAAYFYTVVQRYLCRHILSSDQPHNRHHLFLHRSEN